MVLFPTLVRLFNLRKDTFQLQIRSRGFFPRGMGDVTIIIKPVHQLDGFDMLERGTAIRIEGVVFAGGVG